MRELAAPCWCGVVHYWFLQVFQQELKKMMPVPDHLAINTMKEALMNTTPQGLGCREPSDDAELQHGSNESNADGNRSKGNR